jgi:hypothetical protein
MPRMIQRLIALGLLLAFSFSVHAQLLPPDAPRPRQPEAERVASEWLDLVEANKSAESLALQTDVLRANLTEESWREGIARTNQELGKRLSRELRRIVWYDDPVDAHLPGTYVAVEFDSVFEHSESHFQYVILHSLSGEPFRIMRNEATYVLDQPENGANAR